MRLWSEFKSAMNQEISLSGWWIWNVWSVGLLLGILIGWLI